MRPRVEKKHLLLFNCGDYKSKGGSGMRLSEYWNLRPGVIAVIGSGGKTTLLRTLGEELAAKHRVVLCTTTKILPFPGVPLARTAAELAALGPRRLICAGTPLPGTGKLTGPEIPLKALAERFDYVLVEADGAAGRPLKAHAPWEPVIPPEAARVLHVIGASGFGRPIARAAHRPERYARLAGTAETATASPETEASVLLAEDLGGALFLNQAETPESLAQARALARLMNRPVLAGSLWKGEYESC